MKNLKIDTYLLNSSSEVSNVVNQIIELEENCRLIHIVAYLHNTVLVQTLKKELEKRFIHAKIVLIKGEDKNQTLVRTYCAEKMDDDTFTNEVLEQLYLDFYQKDQDLQKNKRELLKRYFTDHLTHLPNIYQLRKDLGDEENAGLILLKIENFTTINNFYGFIVGDYVMEQVGLYLKEHLTNMKVYRYTGAEFALVYEPTQDYYKLRDYLSSLYEELRHISIAYQNIKIFIDISLAACFSKNTNNIFSKVSMALKYASQNNIPFWIYEDSMHFESEYEQNIKTSEKVRYAVEHQQIIPYFQPIVHNETGKVDKFEALARLVDANGSVVSPHLFLPVAKKIKVYNQITKMLIDKVFDAFESYDYDFSINLSIEDVISNEIFEYIIAKLRNSDLSHRVIFELVESEAIQDFSQVKKFIDEVKRYGARIALDDFGSGYSNFSYLTKIDVDYIKIDGSLIEHLDVSSEAYLVVETIVNFAKKLQIETIAEYVHSSTVMDKVKEIGIDYSQGFHIDKPLENMKKFIQ